MRAIDNPFADVGTVISGDRFIGRRDAIRQIQGRLLGEVGYGSIALIGMPRIGKSSLAQRALRQDEEALASRRIVVTRIDVGEFRSLLGIFSGLVIRCLEEIREFGFQSERLEELGNIALRDDDEGMFNTVRLFFRECKRQGLRIICILEEFDAGRYLFSQNPRCFHWLRELAANPEFKIGLVFVGKRHLSEVSGLAGHDSSYWANVLLTLNVSLFEEEEVSDFFSRLKSIGLSITDDDQTALALFCGRHPYFLDLLAYHAYDTVLTYGKFDSQLLQRLLLPHCREVFRQIVEVLEDGPWLNKLVQILVGPCYDADDGDIEIFLQFGILIRDKTGDLHAFSSDFLEYIKLIGSRVEIWPLWSQTENALRDALVSQLVSVFGSTWQSELSKKRPGLGPILDRCYDVMRKESNKFGFQASDNILDYTYPHEIYQIMTFDWSQLGSPLLGGQKGQWTSKFDLLAQVRNPLAHNRSVAIPQFLTQQVEGVCREVLARLDDWNGRVIKTE